MSEFDDHIKWLASIFIKARADSTGDKFDGIIETQDRVIEIIENVTGGAVPDFSEIYRRN